MSHRIVAIGLGATLFVALLASCSDEDPAVAKIVIKGDDKKPTDAGVSDPGDSAGSEDVAAAVQDAAQADAGPGQLDAGVTDINENKDTSVDDSSTPDASSIDSTAPADVGADVATPLDPDVTADAGPPSSCQADPDCQPWGLFCDQAVGECVQCIYGSDCPGLFATCVDHVCGQQMPCKADAPCAAKGQVCDAFVGHCVDCTKNEDCQVGWLCKAATCIPPPTECQSSKACAALGQVCDKALSACVDCLDDADCASLEFCLEGICLADLCKPGLKQCGDITALLTCVPSGAGWLAEACASGTACALEACANVICTGGTTECVDGGLRTCAVTGTAWSAPKPCAVGSLCLDNTCKAAICVPGSSKCTAEGVSKCGVDGTAWQSEPCPAGKSCAMDQGIALCFDQKCKPAQAFCDGAKAFKCADDGLQSSLAADCGAKGQTCVDGACLEDKCTPAEVSCKGTQVAVCDSSGKAWILQPCDGDKVCKAGQCADPGPCTSQLKALGPQVKADIIVTIDTSSTMKSEFTHVNGALAALGQALAAAGVDHRVVVIGKDQSCCKICVPPPLGMANCAVGPSLKRVNAYVSGSVQLSSVVSQWHAYKSFMRADAERHIIIISDDSSGKDAKWFKDNIAKLSAPGFPKGFVLHAVVSFGSDSKKGCFSGEKPGKVAPQLAKETGGKSFAICETKDGVWQSWFKGLGIDIGKAGAACTYPLTGAMKGIKDLAKSLKVEASSGGAKVNLAQLAVGKTCGNALEYGLVGAPPSALSLCPAACNLVKGAPLSAEHPCPPKTP